MMATVHLGVRVRMVPVQLGERQRMEPAGLVIMDSLVGLGNPAPAAQPVDSAVPLMRIVAKDVNSVVTILIFVSMDHASMAIRAKRSGKHTA